MLGQERFILEGLGQGVTKRCRLSCLTNRALLYDGGGGLRGLTGAQINFGDLTPYLTYGLGVLYRFTIQGTTLISVNCTCFIVYRGGRKEETMLAVLVPN